MVHKAEERCNDLSASTAAVTLCQRSSWPNASVVTRSLNGVLEYSDSKQSAKAILLCQFLTPTY